MYGGAEEVSLKSPLSKCKIMRKIFFHFCKEVFRKKDGAVT